MAAFRAAERGRKTLLLEKKPEPGRKILLSGGNRCNLTHVARPSDIAKAFGPQGPFLRSALAALTPDALVDLFEAEGVPTKSEPSGKIFPRSDRAADVLAALVARLRRSGCEIAKDEALQTLQRGEDGFLLGTLRRTVQSAGVILATGGLSYPGTGSTGDGYRWAAELGHTIQRPRPALVPITTQAPWVRAMMGITIPDAVVQVMEPGADGAAAVCLARRRGALLFAHFGVSGPAVLDVSRAVSSHAAPGTLRLRCDLLPELSQELLDTQLRERCMAAGRRLTVGLLAQWLPQRLAETVAQCAGVDPNHRAAELTRQERSALVLNMKQFESPIEGTMGFRKAEVTAGGVTLAEVDSRTMQSKLVPGLYFAGELLDIDGPIGGYNFQAAFSTGWLAGDCV